MIQEPVKIKAADQNVEKHGGQLYFYPYSSIPIRNVNNKHNPYLLKEDEVNGLTPVGVFKNKLFDLANEADVAEYQEIKHNILKGWFRATDELKQWKDTDSHPKIYLEWVQYYLDI